MMAKTAEGGWNARPRLQERRQGSVSGGGGGGRARAILLELMAKKTCQTALRSRGRPRAKERQLDQTRDG